jgi:hypothetical protein
VNHPTLRLARFSTLAFSAMALALPNLVSAQPYQTKYCPDQTTKSTIVPQGDNRNVNLIVNGACTADGKIVVAPATTALYVFHNVNVVSGGSLTFVDVPIDFHAASILVENKGSVTAGRAGDPIGQNPNGRLTIYLWGASTDPGILCQTDQYCGIPHGAGQDLWGSNTTMAMQMPMPANGTCKKASAINPSFQLPGDDCFYQYEIFDPQDKASGAAAYFGHKVLAVSYGGTLNLYGAKGATYGSAVDANPANTGISWVRLAGVSGNQLTVDLRPGQALDWQRGDEIVVTATDYLPGHSEKAVIQSVKHSTITLTAPLRYPHNATPYALPADLPTDIGPRADPNLDMLLGQGRNVDTRAAVALLTRSIVITSEGDTPDVNQTTHDHFPPNPGNYFGGHTIVRQGFASYQVQGVEFWRLGQGGLIGHYPVHFHMARKTPQPPDGNGPVTFLKDSTIRESMTRWVTVHATQGVTLQRNVGFMSIGHGFYLEDATEVNNKLYANLGITVIAAVTPTKLNPREVPGILARPGDAAIGDLMPFRSDWNHPTAFWIMNGWNDFQYNMAVGVTTCGACYWLLPGANSGPSNFEVWDGYAAQGFNRYGLSPLQNFYGNSCVAAMNSFQTVGDTNACLGVEDDGQNPTPNANVLQAVYNSNAPLKDDPKAAIYYPKLTGFRNPTQCPAATNQNPNPDCSVAPPCASTGIQKTNCMMTVLDHYTTSFNYAQFNFAAVWLRPWWFLVSDSAITDSQYGGLNFVTGGGYTRADAPAGFWSLAYRSVFIGNSQKIGINGMPDNPFASNAGPFNPSTATATPDPVKCENNTFNYCLSKDNAVSMQLNDFGGQRMFSLYDGPSFQQSNAYLDIQPTMLTGCLPSGPGGGQCDGSGWMYGRVGGIPKDSANSCYLPNAAIAWKQPNGFYYPPAFHSENLFFGNVNIRHFLIEPIFLPGTFQTNVGNTYNRYCNFTPGLFTGFTDIDRQTVLNDGAPTASGGDGSLTGLVAVDAPDKMPQRETISVNEDAFFNAPLETPECASDKHTTTDGTGPPGTAKTSPYEYLTTAMIASCAIGFTPDDPDPPILHECVTNNLVNWTQDCGGPFCYGPELYRQYLTAAELAVHPKPHPFIHMMGQGQGQRSTLTVNHGHYYLDTSPNCAAQGGCVGPRALPSHSVSVFQPGQTYFVYFVYGRGTTQQIYDIYLGLKADSNGNVTARRAVLNDNNFVFNTVTGSVNWLKTDTTLLASKGILRVTIDLSQSSINDEFNSAEGFQSVCQPVTYCGVKTVGSAQTCGCKPGTNCKDDDVCSWGPKDPECPEAGCYAFSFTMPGNFVTSNPPAPAPLPVAFTTDPYFASGKVQFSNMAGGPQCDYSNVPKQP